MIDEVKIQSFFNSSYEMNNFIKRSEFSLLPNKVNKFTNEVSSYRGSFRNLHLKIFTDSRLLKVENSIHKFYKGENYSTFTRRENETALNEFEELIKIPLDRFIVKGIGIGLNISLNDTPEMYLPIPQSYRGKLFRDYPPEQGNRIIERVCKGGEMNLKFYDKSAQYNQNRKTFEPKINNPFLFRFEIVFKKMRCLYKILKRTQLTAKELYSESFIIAIAKNHLNLFETIDKKIEMDLSNLTPIDFCLLEKFSEIPPEIKQKHKESYKKNRTYYLKLKKERKFSDSKINEMREKFSDEVTNILSD
jgi:hypothetical protein